MFFNLFSLTIAAALLTSSLGLAATDSSQIPFTVLIDPGHGGHDHGTSHDSIKESRLTMAISKKIIQISKSDFINGDSVRIGLTRKKNNYVSLATRVKYSNKIRPDLFVSLHINSLAIQYVRGMEIYFSEESTFPKNASSDLEFILEDLKNTGRSNKSLSSGQIFQEALSKSSNPGSVNLKKTSFYVLDNNRSASILVELGFLSNEKDRELLLKNSYQDELAQTVYNAILKVKAERDRSKQNTL